MTRVSEERSQQHIAGALDEAVSELSRRYDAAGGMPQQERSEAGFAPYGSAPLRQVRQVFVAKFNPAEADPVVGRFLYSDPYMANELWDHSAPPDCWVSDRIGQTRWTPAHAAIDAGDLIFVYRSQPKIDGRVRSDSTGLEGHPHLLGVWWVTRVHRRYLVHPLNRVVTDVWHVPLVRFDDPVHVGVVRRHSDLRDLSPFTNTTRAALVQATPYEAASLAAACSLPSWVLTDPDPVVMGRRLGKIHTGERSGDLLYRSSAVARYQYIHAIETAASHRVQADLEAKGWDVVSREREPGWGADLDCERQLHGGALEQRAVEVKGKKGRSLTSVVLQKSQHDAAVKSAKAGDGHWRLVMCPQALDAPPPPVVERDAGWVAQNWPVNRIKLPKSG